ncbi:MAG TPA: hypothetical protein VGI58_07270 [Streptosporangiaceae bacterium]
MTREHADVDVMILERDEHALRADLAGVEFALREGDRPAGPWPPGQRLTAGLHRLVLTSNSLPTAAEVIVGSAVGTNWVFHRGSAGPRRPLAAITRTWRAIPYLAPEIILFLKCLADRPKDQHDFDVAWRLLDGEQRAWLLAGIESRSRSARSRAGLAPAPHPWAEVLAAT